jgi:predicted DNA-binding protein (MmcQ/YjbR family)
MNIETIREYCLSKKGVTECFPFNEVTLVFKLLGKIFLFTNLDGELYINVKCDPEKAIEFRELYPSVIPGYHMNKKHWNTIFIDGTLSDLLIFSFIDHSYELIRLSLPRNLQNELINKIL